MRHLSQINESCVTHHCVLSNVCVTWLVRMHEMIYFMRNLTCSQVWHDSFICVAWHIHMCDMTHSYVWHDSFICVTQLIHMCDMTHSYVWHNSFICVTWLIHMCDTTHSYVWHDTFICVTQLIHMCDTTHSNVHASFRCAARLIQRWVASQWHVPWLNQMCSAWLPYIQRFQKQWWKWNMTHHVHHDSYITHDSYRTPHVHLDSYICAMIHLHVVWLIYRSPFASRSPFLFWGLCGAL